MKIPTKVEYIIIYESTLGSIIQDTYTFSCLIGSIGVGYFLGSSALQWIGGFMFIAWIANKNFIPYLTIDQARKRLDYIESHYL